MPRATNSDLARRIAELEVENDELRRTLTTEPAPPAATPVHTRAWGWTVLATALVLIGVVLAPVAIVSSWAKADLTDTDRFVATFAPLADDPDVQGFVTDEAMLVIDENLDIPQLTSDVFDGITSLGTGPRATQAIEALKGPAAAGIRSLIESRLAAFVQSDAFADVWSTALRVTHSQLIATIEGDPDAAVTLGGDGTIGVQLGPIIEAAKSALVDQGIGFASQIPEIDRTITVAQSDAIPTVQAGYGAAVAAGTWLPLVALAFIAAGVIVARRRAVALIAASLALALAMTVLAVGFSVGHTLFVTTVSPALIPSGVARVLYSTVFDAMQATTISVLVLALAIAVVAWFAGPFITPQRVRSVIVRAADGLRDFAEERNVTTGGVGRWVYRWKAVLRAAVAVVAALVVVLMRPVTIPLVLWTLVLSGLVIAVIELVQRPPVVEAEVTEPVRVAADL